MLRFPANLGEAATAAHQRRRVASHQRWRLWMLLAVLGLVIVTMRQLNKPSTARRLGQLFGTPEVAQQSPPSDQFVMITAEASDQPGLAAEPAKAAEPAALASSNEGNTGLSSGITDTDTNANALAQVQDNTYFRPGETEAWFGLFQRLQQMDAQQLRAATLGEITYTQLLKQPQFYRGQIVTIRGTVRLEEVARPRGNSLGIDSYHRLWVQPRGGVNWPLVVYCRHLPDDFPRGEELQAPVSVTGFYFKNWSYASQDGLGIAPVVLAQSVDWQPPIDQQRRRSVTSQGLTQAIIAAGALAMLVVYFVMRNTRRPPKLTQPPKRLVFPDESTVETVQQRLQQLAEAELQE